MGRVSALLALVGLAFVASLTSVDGQVLAPDINYWSSPVPSTVYPARYDNTAVIDKFDRIYVISGNEHTGASNDCWMSPDVGTTWVCQSCGGNVNKTRFSPRYFAGTTAVGVQQLAVAGGMAADALTVFNDVWVSNDQGASWNFRGNAGWPAQRGLILLSDNKADLWVIESIGAAAGANLWSSRQTTAYSVWIEAGPVAISSPARMGIGALIDRQNQLYVAGGSFVTGPTSQHFNDVWVADLTQAIGSIVWQQLTAAAPWSPRASPTLNLDSQGNMYLFGQFAGPNGAVPDLLWYSPVSAGGSLTGTAWIRVDNQTCSGTWPYPNVPDPADFSTVVDSSDRMIIVGAGATNHGNPTNTDATAFIQLNSNNASYTTNLRLGYTYASTCNPTPDPQPDGPSEGGLSGGAKAAIVIIVLMVVGGAAGGGYWWWRKNRSYRDPRTGATESYDSLQ